VTAHARVPDNSLCIASNGLNEERRGDVGDALEEEGYAARGLLSVS